MIECPACKSHIARPFYSAGPQPLMFLNLPKSKDEAKSAPLYPMDFYVCCDCGHVYNASFDYTKVSYQGDSNLMYNQGTGWYVHLEYLAELLCRTCRTGIENKTVIDIGAGACGFLDEINQQKLNTRCVAFEPSIESEICRDNGFEVYTDYFVPQRDIPKFKPGALICRHVLEHLQAPRDFVAEIAYHACVNQVYPIFLAEVPCITKALNTCRITDFLYEHVSNFTQRSLRTMFESVGWVTYNAFLAYNNEVAVWIGRPSARAFYTEIETQAKIFQEHTWGAVTNVRTGLETRRKAGLTIAFWGGTGKGAAFLNAYHLNVDRVVDSDIHKVGYYVPGTAQEIEYADALLENPVNVIVITTRWRAADIYNEIKRKGIKYNELLILDGSHLQTYTEEMYNEETTGNINK